MEGKQAPIATSPGKTFTLQQLKHHLLVLFKITFLCVHYPLTYLSSSHRLLAVITLKKAKERKLMTSSNLRYPYERQKMTLKSCVCGVELKDDKSLLSLHQSLSWPLTRNMRVSLIPFCFCDAISSSHLSDRRYWGKCFEEWSRFEQPRSENGVGPSFICFLYLWWSTVQQNKTKGSWKSACWILSRSSPGSFKKFIVLFQRSMCPLAIIFS